MSCTTLLVGKKASYDGSTIIARNEDCPTGEFCEKRVDVVEPEQQPRHYRSVLSHVAIELPDDPMRYSFCPNARHDQGIWGAAGVNACNVAMSATETLTSNERVLGADPLVEFVAAKGHEGEDGYVAEVAGGIGEEDLVTIVLPYIHSARDGVRRLGSLLEEFGTYEMNGIAFSDVNEIWWLETVGGHHWIARRVPDDCYVTMPNQLGLDSFDLDDALGAQNDFMCSPDLRSFITDNHLDLSLDGKLNPRDAFGSASDADHVYNTPRAWSMQRFLNGRSNVWDGSNADFRPDDNDIPWARVPERKLTIEDVKYVLSLHYQGTPYDPYGKMGTPDSRGAFRPIGINRNCELHVIQLRPDAPEGARAIQWMAFASNPFNALVPLYTNVSTMPAYVRETPEQVSTESFYWSSRLIAALADAQFGPCQRFIEDYQLAVGSKAHELIAKTDTTLIKHDSEETSELLEAANESICEMLREQTDKTLSKVLFCASEGMHNAFSRDD